MTYAWLDPSKLESKPHVQVANDVTLSLPKTFEIPGKSLFSVSFSALASSSLLHVENDAKEMVKTPVEKQLEGIPSIHTLPMGSETGNTLHRLLEKIPLDLLRDGSRHAELKLHVSIFLKGTELAGWEDVVSEMLVNVFTTSLHAGHDSFRLCDLEPYQNYREMEFLFPCKDFKHPVLDQWQEFQIAQGVLKGVIDFIFSWKGKYYMVDWKSNWLGNGREAYGQPQLERAILEHRYDLQAAIYTEALKRYVRLVDRRPFSECFGGIVYLFLRGVHPEGPKNNGVYYFAKDE